MNLQSPKQGLASAKRLRIGRGHANAWSSWDQHLCWCRACKYIESSLSCDPGVDGVLSCLIVVATLLSAGLTFCYNHRRILVRCRHQRNTHMRQLGWIVPQKEHVVHLPSRTDSFWPASIKEYTIKCTRRSNIYSQVKAIDLHMRAIIEQSMKIGESFPIMVIQVSGKLLTTIAINIVRILRNSLEHGNGEVFSQGDSRQVRSKK